MSPYKDAEIARAAAAERKRKQRMSHPVIPAGNVTPVGVKVDVTPDKNVTPDVTPLPSGYIMPTQVAAGIWRKGTCVECGKPAPKGDNCCHGCFFGEADEQ